MEMWRALAIRILNYMADYERRLKSQEDYKNQLELQVELLSTEYNFVQYCEYDPSEGCGEWFVSQDNNYTRNMKEHSVNSGHFLFCSDCFIPACQNCAEAYKWKIDINGNADFCPDCKESN